jgi:serine/threonine-protein kinase
MIGRGGMGEVYRARDMRLNRDVAIKTIAPNSECDLAFRVRLEREARAIAALNHRNIWIPLRNPLEQADKVNVVHHCLLESIQVAPLSR